MRDEAAPADASERSARGSGDTARLLRLADQCVKCGYCLPHCPTFRLRHDEAESPRGRIALVQGWLGGHIPLGERLERHLANCLECRACEPACPSLVRFGTLMDGARARRQAMRPAWQRGLARLRLALLSDSRWLWVIAALGILYRRLGLAWLACRLRLVESSRMVVLDPLARALRWPMRRASGDPVREASAAEGAGRNGAIALFRGCIARAAQRPTERAVIRLLEQLGWAVNAADGLGCCGAMHRHNGYPADADRLLANNRRQLAGAPLVGFASACVAELSEQGGIDAVEVCRFLLDNPWPRAATLAPLDAVVAVHEPCSHRNQLRDSGVAYALLARIPRLQIVPLPGNDLCCGAAGTYLIEQPETALMLAQPKVDALRALAPQFLVTTNTGCALHLGARVRAAGLVIEVLHPVELLARQILPDRGGGRLAGERAGADALRQVSRRSERSAGAEGLLQ